MTIKPSARAIERNIFFGTVEVRQHLQDDDGPIRIGGHAAIFNQRSVDLGGFFEQIAPGAFDETIKGDVRALFNHDDSIVLGRTKSNTLSLSTDDRGLVYEVTLPDTQQARDLVVSIERGDISGSSFGFRTINDHWDEVGDDVVRTLIEVELFDVSPVTFPAYPEADVSIRSFKKWQETANEDVAAAHAARQRQIDLVA